MIFILFYYYFKYSDLKIHNTYKLFQNETYEEVITCRTTI